jgi:Fe-Mn family superoxide dismutase
MTFSLPDLPYAYDALQPFMSAETLEYHHDKHHQVYVDNANKFIQGTGLEKSPLEVVVTSSFGKNTPLFNNVAQHYNHLHFWKWMGPVGGKKQMSASLEDHLVKDFGSVDKFKNDFIQAGISQFGSGWCWLAFNPEGRLEVLKTQNGENPLLKGLEPILGCDVWEHSYYIDFRNRRADYLKAFMDELVNWEYVEELYEKARC